MRGLVVARVLPCHGHAVVVVLHKAGHAVAAGLGGGEDEQVGRCLAVPQHQFLAPVAEDVGLQARRGLGGVARLRVVLGEAPGLFDGAKACRHFLYDRG